MNSTVENIAKLAQRCSDEYRKLAEDPNLAVFGPSQLDVGQAIKAGLAARDAKKPSAAMAGVSSEAFGNLAKGGKEGKGMKNDEKSKEKEEKTEQSAESENVDGEPLTDDDDAAKTAGDGKDQEKTLGGSGRPPKTLKLDISGKKAPGVSTLVGNEVQKSALNKAEDRTKDINVPGTPDDVVTMGSGKQSVGKTFKVGTRTIEINNIIDFQRVFDGKEIEHFTGKLSEVIQNKVAATSSTKLEVKLYAKRLVSNYTGRTHIAGYNARGSGALCCRHEGAYQISYPGGETGTDYQVICMPIFYFKGVSMCASTTRCAWPKRFELIRPQVSQIQEGASWTATTGEVLRRDSVYKRSDWRASVTGSVSRTGRSGLDSRNEDTVLETLHSQFKTDEIGVARPDGTALSDKTFAVMAALKDVESVQAVAKVEGGTAQIVPLDFLKVAGDLKDHGNTPEPRAIGRLVLSDSHGASALMESRDTVVLLARSLPELRALTLIASVATYEGRIAVQCKCGASGLKNVERDENMSTASAALVHAPLVDISWPKTARGFTIIYDESSQVRSFHEVMGIAEHISASDVNARVLVTGEISRYRRMRTDPVVHGAAIVTQLEILDAYTTGDQANPRQIRNMLMLGLELIRNQKFLRDSDLVLGLELALERMHRILAAPEHISIQAKLDDDGCELWYSKYSGAATAFPIGEPLRDDYRVRMFIEYRSLHKQRSMPQEVVAHFGRLIAHKHLQAQLLETAMTAVTEQELICGLAPSSKATSYIFDVTEICPAKKETLSTSLTMKRDKLLSSGTAFHRAKAKLMNEIFGICPTHPVNCGWKIAS